MVNVTVKDGKIVIDKDGEVSYVPIKEEKKQSEKPKAEETVKNDVPEMPMPEKEKKGKGKVK